MYTHSLILDQSRQHCLHRMEGGQHLSQLSSGPVHWTGTTGENAGTGYDQSSIQRSWHITSRYVYMTTDLLHNMTIQYCEVMQLKHFIDFLGREGEFKSSVMRSSRVSFRCDWLFQCLPHFTTALHPGCWEWPHKQQITIFFSGQCKHETGYIYIGLDKFLQLISPWPNHRLQNYNLWPNKQRNKTITISYKCFQILQLLWPRASVA